MTEIDNLDELIKQFNALGGDMIKKLGGPCTTGAELIASRARAKVHSISGDLVKGIKVRRPSQRASKSKLKIFAHITLVHPSEHGVNVELGHKMSGYFGSKKGSAFARVPEHPFLRPAADESKQECANIITNAMNDIIKEYSP